MVGNVSKISGSFHAEPSRVAAENDRISAENQRIQNEEERQSAEILRRERYDGLCKEIERDMDNINAIASHASEVTQKAESSGNKADSAAESANTAAVSASQKADLAHEKATLAQEKADLAHEKAVLADSKAIAADTAAEEANSAAESANAAKIKADSAAEKANSAAEIANMAADRVTEPLQAKNITYDNSDSELISENVKAALDELQEKLQEELSVWDSSLTSHKTDSSAHEAAFLRERSIFNPLYCNALKGEQAGSDITIADAVEGTPVSLSLYGATTETLADPSAEKSPDNPATITGIGESGSVTVTVTAADGTEETIEIPLSQPLYGILNQETKEWVRQDEIRVENGKVLLIRKIGKVQITENLVNFTFNRFYGEAILIHVIPNWNCYHSAYLAPYSSNPERYVACPLLVSGWDKGSTAEKDIALGYSGGYKQYIGIRIAADVLGLTTESTEAEIEEAFKTFCSTRDDFIVYYVLNDESVSEEDISDTEAGQALLALTSQNSMTITNSEGAEMKAEYNRDINKALKELSAAVVASV